MIIWRAEAELVNNVKVWVELKLGHEPKRIKNIIYLRSHTGLQLRIKFLFCVQISSYKYKIINL